MSKTSKLLEEIKKVKTDQKEVVNKMLVELLNKCDHKYDDGSTSIGYYCNGWGDTEYECQICGERWDEFECSFSVGGKNVGSILKENSFKIDI